MASPIVRLPLAPGVARYLEEQGQLSAVERFVARREPEGLAREERFYRDLIPGGGRQYAFRVDLDACTACKACVTACHGQNGLDEGETWRKVGLLHGGSREAPVLLPVTTSCHHCVEPACLRGCPALAYEKDPTTGIVEHLDDQCIGCQYCTFTCPYDAPQWSPSRGIVRKCDMCKARLAAGDAPACVAACPSDAISITLADAREVREAARDGMLLPTAPPPAATLPTTRYDSARALPANLSPADLDVLAPSPPHASLAVMLVLTQLSAGAVAVSAVAGRLLPGPAALAIRPLHAGMAAAVGLLAHGAGLMHLGRPRRALRAVLGIRTSWLSREVVAATVFVALAAAGATLPRSGGAALEAATAAAGLAAVACSVLVYHVTRRPFWNARRTGFVFVTTAVVLGLATLRVSRAAVAPGHGAAAARLLAAAASLKLAGEIAFFRHLRDGRKGPLARTARLMRDELRTLTLARFATGIAGGVVLPILARPGSVRAAIAALVLLVSGEILERTLFFAAESTPGMPGGLR